MRYLAALVLALCPIFAAAQEDDAGFLTRLIEENLSDVTRTVDVVGFEGALSSAASIERLTIADRNGIWLEMEDLSLVWTRSALLRGRIDIEELSAGRIALLRAPLADPSAPSPEAMPFQLPELPVSVEIGKIVAERIELGPDFVGEPLVATLEGSVDLASGEGSGALRAERIDGRLGRFDVSGSYSNETEQLKLNLLAEEGAGGIAARAIGLPGEPSARLSVSGDDPITDFTATLSLATDGQERLGGEARLVTDRSDDPAVPARRFDLSLGGDVSPLFAGDYRDFLGTRTRLEARGEQGRDGALLLERFALEGRSIQLSGEAVLGADGWPERFDVSGRLADPDGAPILLPLSGTPTRVGAADLSLAFDAAEGDRWAADITATEITTDGITVPRAVLAGGGEISPRSGRFSGDLLFSARELEIGDPGLARAIGPDVAGRAEFAGGPGQPFELSDLSVTGPGLEARASATVAVSGLQTELTVIATAADLDRFSRLAGLDLGGSGEVTLLATLKPLEGGFDGLLSAETRDLSFGIDRLDPLLGGDGTVSLSAVRDGDGTRIEGLRIATGQAEITGAADLTSTGSTARLSGTLSDLSLVDPSLRGDGTIRLFAEQDTGGTLRLSGEATGPDARVDLGATIAPAEDDFAAQGTLTARIDRLSRYSDLLGQQLSGAVTLQLTGEAEPYDGTFRTGVTARTENLGIGSPSANRLLAGIGSLSAQITRTTGGTLEVTGLELSYPNLSGSGMVTAGDTVVARFEARLRDLALFTDDLSGPVTATGTARQVGGDWTVDLSARGPGGTRADIAGRIGADGLLDLSATGEAPLGLANAALAPRRIAGRAAFDLALRGPAGLSGLSGRIATTGARLSIPTVGQAVEDITGEVQIGGGTARLDFAARYGAGGRLTLAGPIAMTGGFDAGLEARIDGLTLTDPTLYETTADGSVRVTGPLAGGAVIAGALTLGPTEIRVPSSTTGLLGALPEVRHVGAPADVRQTLGRAGLTTQGREPAGTVGRPYPLDLTISAPSRVFVRGRGLDAEMGGTLRLRGTTANIQPQGQFDLLRGRIDILQRRFVLTEGLARLQGDFDPFIRLEAETQTETGSASIIVEGSASSPQISFSSSPELPEDEVLSQLIFGRGLGSITPLQAVQLASAVNTLAGRGGPGLVQNFRQGVGLDDLDISTSDDGETQLRAGKYLSENIYSDVTVTGDGTSEINLNLDITDDITARGSLGSDGNSSVGIFIERDY